MTTLPPEVRYVLRRLAQAVAVLWAAWTVSFVVLDLLPSDPVAIMANGGMGEGQLTQDQLDGLRHSLGYDRPTVVRYLVQLGHLLTGNLGTSSQSGRPVTEVLGQALPQTAVLTLTALLLAVIGGGALALAATRTRRDWLAQSLLSLPTVGVSLPTFWVGLVLVQLVSFQWGLLPALGNEGWKSLVLPAVTLALPIGAQVAQVLAKSLSTALAEPYAETARAKGASAGRVQLRHALPNAALPALTVTGVLLGQLLAGAVIVETVFSRTGLGRTTVSAVNAQDIPVVQGVVLTGAVVFVVANLLVDLLYPLLDPRITTVPEGASA